MIYTLTLNPCLDRHLEVDDLHLDDANRVLKETRYAAGKGVDVSVVVSELGGTSTALGFLGGYSGLELEGKLVNRGVNCRFTQIAGETRTNIHILNRTTGTQTSLNARGPSIRDVELGAFRLMMGGLDPAPSFLCLSGSIPQGVTTQIYAQIASWVGKDVCIVLDADGDAFRAGLMAQPQIIKPNLHELSRYLGEDARGFDDSDLVSRCGVFLDMGIETVVLSMGARGLLIVMRDRVYRIRVPKVAVKSTIGSGDSVIGGLVFQLAGGADLREAARWGAACGTATAMTPGTELCRRPDVVRLLESTTAEQLDQRPQS